MALVLEKYWITITIRDSGGNDSQVRYDMTATDDIAAATAATAILGYFEAVCAAGTVNYSITKRFYNDAFVLPADNSVQNEVKALLVMQDETVPSKRHTVRIPAPETDVFLAVTGELQNVVDIAHQDVLDFANMFSTAGECYISDGERILDNGLLRGKRVTHYASGG